MSKNNNMDDEHYDLSGDCIECNFSCCDYCNKCWNNEDCSKCMDSYDPILFDDHCKKCNDYICHHCGYCPNCEHSNTKNE